MYHVGKKITDSKGTSKADKVYEMKADRKIKLISKTLSHFRIAEIRIEPTAVGPLAKPPNY